MLRTLMLSALLVACDGTSTTTPDAETPTDDAATADAPPPPKDASVADAPQQGDTGATRDKYKQPFATTSIWNMPLGSGAVYVAAKLRAVPDGSGFAWSEPFAEAEQIILEPTAPLTDIRYSDVGWGGGDRCPPTSSQVFASVPIPSNFLVPSNAFNMAAAILGADGRSIYQFEPFTHCKSGSPATAFTMLPQTSVDIYGDGIQGAHGGSGLSALGGTIRLGELRAGNAEGPHHVLKFTYDMRDAYKCTKDADCFRWPALWGDSYAVGVYGTSPNNPNVANKAMKMGALFALPPSVDINSLGLQTEPAKLLAWTLQNYGAYIDDDAYGNSFLISVENSPSGAFVDQFQSDFGFAFNQSSDATGGGGKWTGDIQKLLPLLNVVDNNSATSIGGGGTPRQPLAPPIGN